MLGAAPRTMSHHTTPRAIAPDSSCDSRSPSGTARVVAAVTLTPADSTQRVPATFIPYVIDALQQHYTTPAKIDIPVLSDELLDREDGSPAFDRDGNARLPAQTIPNLYVHAYFTLHSDAPPSDIAIGGGSASALLEASVVNAIRALTPDEIGPLPGGMGAIRLELVVRAHPAHYPYPPALFVADLPMYRVDQLPTPAGDRVIFPKSATNVLADDSLVVRFVVDETGRIPPASVEFLRGRYREFSQAIIAWVPRARFTPARADGCPVAMVFSEWYAFHNHVAIH